MMPSSQLMIRQSRADGARLLVSPGGKPKPRYTSMRPIAASHSPAGSIAMATIIVRTDRQAEAEVFAEIDTGCNGEVG
jgi:hypothetical protein